MKRLTEVNIDKLQVIYQIITIKVKRIIHE
jgi:hypothetical protein